MNAHCNETIPTVQVDPAVYHYVGFDQLDELVDKHILSRGKQSAGERHSSHHRVMQRYDLCIIDSPDPRFIRVFLQLI